MRLCQVVHGRHKETLSFFSHIQHTSVSIFVSIDQAYQAISLYQAISHTQISAISASSIPIFKYSVGRLRYQTEAFNTILDNSTITKQAISYQQRINVPLHSVLDSPVCCCCGGVEEKAELSILRLVILSTTSRQTAIFNQLLPILPAIAMAVQ